MMISCEKELDINLPGVAPKIVINSKVFQDSVFRADIYRTSIVTEYHNNLWYIDSAKVDLYSNGVFIETLKLDSLGRYSGQHRVEANANYKLNVEVNKFPTAHSQITVLDKVPIIRLDSIGTMIDVETKGIFYKFAICFKDNENTNDYYMIDFTDDREIEGKSSEIFSNDPAIEVGGEGFTSFGSTTYSSMYFSDELFNGKEYSFSINVPEYKIYEGFTVNLCHVTPEYFKYIQTYNAQSEADGMEMFFQAVQVYNNIENGLGVFGALSTYTHKYQFESSDDISNFKIHK